MGEQKRKLTKIKKKVVSEKRGSMKVLIFLGITIYFLSLVYTVINKNYDIYEVNYGEIEQSINLDGLLIQTESVLARNVDSNTVFQKNEGDRVARYSTIAVVQSANYAKNINDKIARVDEEIKNVVMKSENNITKVLFNSDIEKLEEEIQGEVFEIVKGVERGSYSDIISYKQSIDKNLRKIIEISGKSGPTAERISALLLERNNYEEQLNQSQNRITANKSGLVSYKIDGFEDTVNTSMIGNIDVANLKSIINNVNDGKYNVTSGIKIIDNFEYYISFVIEDKEVLEKIREKQKVWLRIGEIEDLIDAEIYNIKDEEKASILTVKVTGGFESNVNQRIITADVIWQKDKGLMVPLTSIVKQSDKEGIIAVVSNYFKFKEIDVIVRNDKYAIVKETNFNLHEYNKESKVVLYDQILRKGALNRIGKLYIY